MTVMAEALYQAGVISQDQYDTVHRKAVVDHRARQRAALKQYLIRKILSPFPPPIRREIREAVKDGMVDWSMVAIASELVEKSEARTFPEKTATAIREWAKLCGWALENGGGAR